MVIVINVYLTLLQITLKDCLETKIEQDTAGAILHKIDRFIYLSTFSFINNDSMSGKTKNIYKWYITMVMMS